MECTCTCTCKSPLECHFIDVVCTSGLQALNYSPDLLGQREVVPIDIATEQLSSGEYKPEQVTYLINTHVLPPPPPPYVLLLLVL